MDHDLSNTKTSQKILDTFYETIADTTIKTNDNENKNRQRINVKKRKHKSKSNQLFDTTIGKTDDIKNIFIVGNGERSEENPVNSSAALTRAWIHVGKVKTGC